MHNIENMKSGSATADVADELSVGVKVEHGKFGVGIIRKIEGDGAKKKVVVWFENSETKTLLLRFANLKLIHSNTNKNISIPPTVIDSSSETPQDQVSSLNIELASIQKNIQESYPQNVSGPRKLDFNQTERITARLRDLVRNYPKGLGLVKEFLQNADDAGATNLKIIYDRRQHNGSFSSLPEMKIALGPSLLFINDQTFSAEDIERIQQIGEGGKVREAARTGRFGQGFNTCYSVSDHPSLMTGETVAWFDPHHTVFKDGGNASAWPLKDVEEYWPDWIKAFKPAGWVKGRSSFPGTVFRLPLRTKIDAEKSEILKEPFCDEDFSSILNELHHAGASLLVFLRSVSSLEVREIDPDGTDRLRFSISTANLSVVEEHRNKLRSLVVGNPKELLEGWIRNQMVLPISQYDHSFSIYDIDGSERNELWAVVSGLFRGPEDLLLHKALEVWDHFEKALPWAGAAVCRDQGNNSNKYGGLSCFLPLPEPTKLPLWLHGWFDLSSNRKGITRSEEVGETTKIRFLWNKVLMEHAVGPSWAQLVQYIHGEPGENEKPYELWLRQPEKPDDIDNALSNGFYQTASGMPILRCRDLQAYTWQRLDRLSVDLPSEWRNVLAEPLIAEGWIISDPSFPRYLKDGFKRINSHIPTLTPKLLRSKLLVPEEDPDISCAIESAPRPMLGRLEWIYAITEFCADGDWGNLKQLPLALLSDGLLHTYNSCGKVFLADNDDRDLLPALPERFIDQGYQDKIEISPAEEINLHDFNLSGLIEFAPQLLTGDTPENTWLIKFFDYLTSSGEDQIEAVKEDLHELALIPDQNGTYCTMGRVETPLIPGSASSKLRTALKELGIPILTSDNNLESAITRFSSKHDDFVWNLTPHDIADNLKSHIDEACMNEEALDNRDHLDPLLDFLSSTDWLKESDKRLPFLKQFRLLPTTCNQRVAAQDASVFVPGGFIPPDGLGGKYRLLDLGKGKSWLTLYKVLGVATLDGITFIEKVFLPAFQSAERSQCKVLLLWLRDEFRFVEKGLEEGKRKQLRGKIRQTSIVPVEGGGLQPPRLVYKPGSAKTIELLQEYAFVPDREFFSTDKDLWLEFFEEFHLPVRPLAKDIYLKIKSLTEESIASGVVAVRGHLRKLLDHLRENWRFLSEKKVDGSTTLAEALSDLAWLTATSDGEAYYAACNKWPEQLWRANELVPGRLANLVASKYPILEGNELQGEMSEALGLLTSVKLEEVIAHFWKVLKHPLENDKNKDALNRSAEAFYRFIGHAEIDKDPQKKASLMLVATKPCIFVNGKWWHPDKCFIEPMPINTDWAVSLTKSDLRITEQSVQRGVELLGVRKQLDSDDWVQLLADFAEVFDGGRLPNAELSQVRYAIRMLRSETTEWLRSKDVYVPLVDGSIERSSRAFYPDDHRLNNYSGPADLPLIENNEDAYDVGHRAGAKSLRGALVERLKGITTASKDAHYNGIAAKLENNLKSKQFYQCLQRIAYEEALRSRDSEENPLHGASKDQLKRPKLLQVTICPAIKVETVVLIDGEEIIVFNNDVASFLEDEIPKLWLKEGKERRIIDETVRAICRLCELNDQLRISRVMDIEPEFMSRVLDEEEVATIPEGQQIELSDNSIEEESEGSQEVVSDLDEFDAQEDIADEFSEPADGKVGEQTENVIPEKDSIEETITRPLGQHGDDSENKTQRPVVAPLKPGQGSSAVWSDPSSESSPKSVESGESSECHTNEIPEKEKPSREINKSRQSQTTGTATQQRSHPEGPPTKPGDGSSNAWNDSSKSGTKTTQQVRLRTYVHEKSNDDYDTGGADSISKELGDAGEKRVVLFEKKLGRSAHQMPVNNKGYDIESTGPDGMRYIEVKSVDGPWGERGVGVTKAQYEMAMRLGDNWWLYVVEYVRNEELFAVHPIANPFYTATEYRFDSGWKEAELVTDQVLNPLSIKPQIGASYERKPGEIVKIEGTTQHGELWRVRFIGNDGEKRHVIWDASWRKVD